MKNRDQAPGSVPTLDPDEAFIGHALEEARRGADAGEVPIGAVVVLNGEIVGRAHNAPIGLADPTAHAEVLALREAARKIANYRLAGATLYVTVEPCAMCTGAALTARIARLVYGATDAKAGAVESLHRLLDDRRTNHRVAVRGGVLTEDCAALLRQFFESRRTRACAEGGRARLKASDSTSCLRLSLP